MKNNRQFSILFPYYEDTKYRQLSDTACHDLGLDIICKELTDNPEERNFIMNVISNMTADPRVALYRQKVFADILKLPDFRKRMKELFEEIEFIRNFALNNRKLDEKLGLWHLLHRLDDLDNYIKSVEAMRECLSDTEITSEGLVGFRNFVNGLYEDACFSEMKKDIAELKQKTSNIQSVTLGVNVNERFEAVSMGLVSINNKPFKKSGIVSNFVDAIAAKEKIKEGTDWNGDMHYHQVEMEHSGKAAQALVKMAGTSLLGSPFLDDRVRETIVKAADGDGVSSSTFYLDNILNKMLDSLVKKLHEILTKYANVAVLNISQVIPEFAYYIRFAEFIDKHRGDGLPFCEARLIDGEDVSMEAAGFYNLKLALNITDKEEIIYNNLGFDREHTIYILTGANRGGKTTVTQAVGLMFVLSQGGISVPAKDFGYSPVDCIYTHFPADEDKTMDLGRLGEECVRFKEIYTECTMDSLLLLNETFSTTSFEEGYYIARDSIRALLKKKVRTIYNTHMHKLAYDAAKINEGAEGAKAASLVVKSENGKRSFKVEVCEPEGMSYARDIAEKYGVTYEMLTGDTNKQ